MKLLMTVMLTLTFACGGLVHADSWNPFAGIYNSGQSSSGWWYQPAPKKKKKKVRSYSKRKKSKYAKRRNKRKKKYVKRRNKKKKKYVKRKSKKKNTKTARKVKRTKSVKRSKVQAVAPVKKQIIAKKTKKKSSRVKRPPQYVMLAFDGSKSHSMWGKTINFAEAHNIKFTYFISGVYFVSNKDRKYYREPKRGAGRSAIGWGGKNNDVAQRVQHVLRAYRKGHEIASHANGHYNGSKYSYGQWMSELTQFDNILKRSWKYTGTATPKSWINMINDVIGLRAPLLGYNNNMYKSLKRKRYRYDTSRARGMNYWPKKVKGSWDYPLAGLRIWGTNKRTLSMDYNFYVADSKGKRGNSANYKAYENRMVKTYLAYFKKNYFGNRAPIDIGHHFSMWNGGAYWKAMKRFAKTVCGMPEVICGTYTELTEFLEDTPKSTLRAYQYANFSKMREQDVNMPAVLSRVSNDNFQFTELSESELKTLEHQHHRDHHKAHDDDGNPELQEWAPGTYEI